MLFVFVIGVGLLGMSCLPFETLKPIIDSLSVDGKVDTFTITFFYSIALKCKILGIALLLATGLLLVYRRKLQQTIYTI